MRRRAIILGAVLGFALLSYAQAPIPFINLPLIPDATAPGGAQFTLTVNGTGFVSNSIVNWNGTPLATQFVNGSQLTATVPAADIATAGTGWITVVNPAPGGGTSNTAFFAVMASESSPIGFNLASSPSVGGLPFSVAVGDFNGDGKLDLAVANSESNTVSILLGDGTGNFTLASSPAVGAGPESVAVGDFNGDGKLDLAVGNYGDATVSVLLGDGTGNFTLASTLAVAPWTQSVAVGDFNGDGKLDLAVASANGMSILLGDGTGNFTLASSPAVGAGPASVAVGDFNGDGKLDLAVTTNGGPRGKGTVSVLLGDGTGNFTLASSPSTDGFSPLSVVVGDFNGDGKLDLAVSNWGSGTVSALLGDGTGNFTLASTTYVQGNLRSVAVGDFNGDGKLDLAVANQSGGVAVLLGDGTGNFSLAGYPAEYNALSVAVGDFNGDGKPDLAAVSGQHGTASILLQAPPVLAVGFSPSSLTFPAQLIGTNSTPQPVTLTNTGNVILELKRVVTSSNFSQTNTCYYRLLPGQQCTANVVFTPQNINTINGKMSIYDNALNSPQTVPLTGVGTAVTLLPSSLNFGNLRLGHTSQPQTVTLTNYAPKAVTIYSGYLTGPDPQDFYVSNITCGESLPPGGSCTASIAFTPKSQGPRAATVNVNDNAGGSPQTVSLSGNGT